MSFQTAVDIANRALQHCGALRIDTTLGFAENSRQASECGFVYDKVRLAELRRNVWRFATRKTALRPIDSNTMILVPALWLVGTTYYNGSIVADATGQLWISKTGPNLGNDPTTSVLWQQYFGSMTVTPYDSTTSYYAGEVVYTAPGDGTSNIYLSQVNNNAVDPSLPSVWITSTIYSKGDVVVVYPAWSSITTYTQGQTVTFTDGKVYSSLINGNLNFSPSTNPTRWVLVPILTISSQPVPSTTVITPISPTPVGEWLATTTYSTGNFIMYNGVEYVSIVNANTANKPSSSPTFWSPVTLGVPYISLVDLNYGNAPASFPTLWSTSFVLGPGNQQWLQIGGATFPGGVTLTAPNIIYPLGTGPASQTRTRNIFQLPAGFLREAPQDPKAGSSSFLGAPSGLFYTDFKYENNYIVTDQASPMLYRFCTDTVDVTSMDPMFCEMLGCRIALEVCETLTQSADKLKVIASEYEKFAGEARVVNGIETGPTEPPEDDFVTCRW